ncbi:MAG: DUF3618 domain-containing protein [Alphaproteobacteria bacterium]|nr:DUF3618 domain-containing protein [Alphaproteobacteria bacterium]MBV9374950.1 DUF3618 domain-containing protein [Alphaproteobacteria bacterium]
MNQSTDRITAARPDSHNGSKPANEIEEDIARTRVRLSATIEALERELTPDRVLERSTDLLRGSLDPGPGPFRDQVWAYAIPLALIVTGLGWLFLLRRRSYEPEMPAGYGEMPAEEIESGVTPAPEPSYTDVAGQFEPVSLVDESR